MNRLSKSARILLLASCLWNLGEALLGPMFAVYTEKIGGDLLDFTWAWAAYSIVTGVLYIVVGKTLRESPYKAQFMIGGYALNALLTFAYIFVHHPIQLLFVQIGLGVAEAFSTPTWDSLFASDMDDTEDTFLWGLANGHTHLIGGLGIAIGGMVAYYFSFNALFVIMGVIQIAATIVQARILHQRKAVVVVDDPVQLKAA